MFRYIDQCVDRITRVPYPIVPHSTEIFLQTHSRIKLAKKYLHRYLALKASGQLRHEIKRIEKGMRVLWLYTGKSNFGDAIMDMSGRGLLQDAGVQVDLLTLPKLHPVFCEDDIFGHVDFDVEKVRTRRYDAILLNEFNHPSIQLKSRYFKDTPFACLFQYFYGPDRNQTLFSFAAVNDVFGLGHTDAELDRLAKPYLRNAPATTDRVLPKIPSSPFVALAVGGIDANRTYDQWPALLESLDADDDPATPRHIVLLGSENGLGAAEAIRRCTFKRLRVVSLVGELSLLEAREVVDQSGLFIGCDGGLMHAAHSTQTPSVSLFSCREPFHLRLTEGCRSIGIQSGDSVSAISPAAVLAALKQQWTTAGAQEQMETTA